MYHPLEKTYPFEVLGTNTSGVRIELQWVLRCICKLVVIPYSVYDRIVFSLSNDYVV